MLHTIKLHGFLGDKYGKEVRLAGANMFQLMSGLVARFGPQFKEDVRTSNWHVLLGNKKANKDMGEEDLAKPIKDRLIHLIPAIMGASATARIIVGVVMMVAGYYFQQPWLVKLGAVLVLGGVVQLLTTPKLAAPGTDNSNQKASDLYNGPVNVMEQGYPVPIIFGRVSRCSSVVISADFSTDEVTP
jgi:predicted phage tail protein